MRGLDGGEGGIQTDVVRTLVKVDLRWRDAENKGLLRIWF
jgi:hypothetical protein